MEAVALFFAGVAVLAVIMIYVLGKLFGRI